jgi:hypothetical protein
VLSDATLTVAYSFADNLLDNGPLGINGTGTSIQYTISGRVGPGLILAVSPSYVQATGLVYLGTDEHPYSFSIWVKPTMINGGTIIHVSSGTSTIPWSMPVLGLTSAGNVGVQGCSTTSNTVSLIGPVLSPGMWTHLVVTYDSSSQLRLWVNGTQYAASPGSFISSTIDAPVTVTLGASVGNISNCSLGVITMGQYSGFIDEFQLFSRELSAADVLSLASP